MSPDALKGARTIETDIWSVGVIFYQLLTGKMPYLQKEQVNLMYAILNDEPQPLPDLVPQSLREIIEHAIRKNPDERYQSAKEMRDALRELIRAKPEPVIEQKTATPQPKVEDEREIKKLPKVKVEDENKTQQMTPQHPTSPSPQEETKPTQKPTPLLDTIPTPQPFQSNVVTPAPQMPKKNIGIWFGVVGGVGLLAVVILLFAFVPSTFRNENVSDNPATNTPQTRNASDKTRTANLPNGVKLEMVLIPSGSFMMGSPDSEKGRDKDEGPQHRVTIGYEFYVGKFEVTQAQWQAVVGTNPSKFSGCDNCPVEQVSWNDAKEFIKKLNALNDGYTYRLPSEAEWEYACRAGTATAFSFGNTLSSSQANFDGNHPYGGASKGVYKEKTTPVGSYQANAFGLYDMHGNVWEWVEDIYQDSYNRLPTDGSANMSKGDSSLRVLRGGSWYYVGRNLRSADRLRSSADFLNDIVGVRVIASLRTQ